MTRVPIELFVPPLLGPLCVVLAIGTRLGHGIPVSEFLPVITIGGVLSLGSSVPYTIAMELAFRCGLPPRSRAGVLVSAVLGLIAGVALWTVLCTSHGEGLKSENRMLLGALGGAGAWVGLVAGALTYWQGGRRT